MKKRQYVRVVNAAGRPVPYVPYRTLYVELISQAGFLAELLLL